MSFRNRRFTRYIPKPGTRMLKSIAIAAMFALVCGSALTPAPALAQTGPAQCDEKPGGGKKVDALKSCEEDLNLAQDEMLVELEGLLDEVEAMLPDIDLATLSFTDAETGEESNLKKHMANMGRQNDRAWAAIAESENDEFEEMVAQGGKKKGQKCEWQETEDYDNATSLDELLGFLPTGLEFSDGIVHSNFSDGICNVFKATNRSDGKLVNVQERSNNLCERVCGDKDVPGGGKKKDKIKERHIARKNEGIDATGSATTAIKNARDDMVAMNVLVDAYGLNFAFNTTFPECELSGEGPQKGMVIAKVALVPVLVGLKVLTRVLEGAKDGANSACRQTVAGFNTSLVCIPGIVLHQVSQGAVDVVDGLIVELDGVSELFDRYSGDATNACVKSIRKNQATMMTSVNQLNRRVNALTKEVGDIGDALEGLLLENRRYIKNTRDIVLTPHGRRTEVPLYEAQ